MASAVTPPRQAINDLAQELAALDLDHLAEISDGALERHEELVEVDQVYGDVAAASDLRVMRVCSNLGHKLVATGHMRWDMRSRFFVSTRAACAVFAASGTCSATASAVALFTSAILRSLRRFAGTRSLESTRERSSGKDKKEKRKNQTAKC